MRSVSPTAKAWLAANNVAWRGDLLTLTLQDGTTVYRWTTADLPLTLGGHTFLTGGANAPLLKRSQYVQNAGLTIDTLDLTLTGGGFQIGGKTLPQLGVAGYFNGARVKVDHLFGDNPGHALTLGGADSFFEGRVGQVEVQGPNLILHLNSELIALNVQLPKFVLAPSCGNVVYDANCGLSRAAFTDVGAASGVPTKTTVPTTSVAVTARAADYYDLGVLRFTSGVNNGLARAVKAWSGSVFTMMLPFPAAPTAGDTFTVYPGCNRSEANCGTPFNNLVQFRAFPHIPSTDAGA